MGRAGFQDTAHRTHDLAVDFLPSSYSLVKCETVNEWDWESCLLVKKRFVRTGRAS